MTANKPHKGVYILPNLFTTGSLFSAFICVTLCFKGDFHTAALAIFFSALLDGLDGKVARLTNTSSEFGVQYDSLADCVAFGLAPSVLIWTWQLQDFGRVGLAISFMFVACAALRLARFNVDVNVVSKRYFIGLPSPAAGCGLASFVLFQPYMPPFFVENLGTICLVLGFILPLLMVTRVRYFAFKEFGMVKKHPFRTLVVAMLLIVIIFSLPYFWAFVFFFAYAVYGIVYTYIFIPHRNNQLLRRLTQSPGSNV